jgi:uncharacterized alkaline shock family protein YloU
LPHTSHFAIITPQADKLKATSRVACIVIKSSNYDIIESWLALRKLFLGDRAMSATEESFGTIDISKSAVATIANRAVNQCYGVVGMANKSLMNGLANLFARDSRRGIDVTMEDGAITIDVYVIVEYGTRIRVVAESIQNTVKFHVEKALGIPVEAVNVYVHGLRLSDGKS